VLLSRAATHPSTLTERAISQRNRPVDGDPTPSLGSAQGATEHRVTLANRRERERLALVRRAPLITGVRPRCAVLDEGPAVAASAAGPEFRIELLERPRTEPAVAAHRCVTECRADEAVDQQPVRSAGGLLDLVPESHSSSR
jgi:hypothetical protein